MALETDQERLWEIARKAEEFAKEHIVVISEEMLEWQKTTLLRDGRVRELARFLGPLADSHVLSVAESYARSAAFEFVVQQGKVNE